MFLLFLFPLEHDEDEVEPKLVSFLLAPPVSAVSELTLKFWFQFSDAIIFGTSLPFFFIVTENTHMSICLSVQGCYLCACTLLLPGVKSQFLICLAHSLVSHYTVCAVLTPCFFWVALLLMQIREKSVKLNMFVSVL